MFHRSFSRNSQPRFRGSSGKGRRFGRFAPKKFIPSSQYVHQLVPLTSQETPKITHQFTDFSIDPRLQANIVKRGYTTPTPIQDQTIAHILAGRDVVGIANTGTGKTAAFLIPLIHKVILNPQERVLVVVPTRELAVQINDELKAFTQFLQVSSLLCIGGSHLERQLFALKRHQHFVIGTPGRLIDLIKRRALVLGQFKTIVLDEVDRMVDIGFINDIKYMIALLPKERQSLFFSATIPPQVSGIIQSFLKNPITISVKKTETAAGIEQDVIRVRDKNEKVEKLNVLLRQDEFKKVLIFGRTKWGVDKLAKSLEDRGFLVATIHGNKSQSQRLRALSQFKQNQLQILVATDIAARGLDIENVSHVINFDEPSSYEDYVHRIGRTGRADKRGKALTFVGS